MTGLCVVSGKVLTILWSFNDDFFLLHIYGVLLRIKSFLLLI
jgi:hypothetical protein